VWTTTARFDTDGDDGTVTIDRMDRHDALDSATLPAIESALADAWPDNGPATTGAGNSAGPVVTRSAVSPYASVSGTEVSQEYLTGPTQSF
jgi:enoyl-CoA hydratase/carnithine racemase